MILWTPEMDDFLVGNSQPTLEQARALHPELTQERALTRRLYVVAARAAGRVILKSTRLPWTDEEVDVLQQKFAEIADKQDACAAAGVELKRALHTVQAKARELKLAAGWVPRKKPVVMVEGIWPDLGPNAFEDIEGICSQRGRERLKPPVTCSPLRSSMEY